MGGGPGGDASDFSISHWNVDSDYGGSRDIDELENKPFAEPDSESNPLQHHGSTLEGPDQSVHHAKQKIESPSPVHYGPSTSNMSPEAAEYGGKIAQIEVIQMTGQTGVVGKTEKREVLAGKAAQTEVVGKMDQIIEVHGIGEASGVHSMNVDTSECLGGEHSAHLSEREKGSEAPSNTTRLYNLMQIKTDKQDLSFVEKVMLQQDEIFNLCNGMVLNSARKSGHDQKHLQLRYSELNKRTLQYVGYYGDKNVMRDIFRATGLLDSHSLELMESKEKLQPGLYAVLHDDTLHILYWHQGESNLLAASRKDISCNFIRYLIELCDIVHICLNAAGLDAFLSESKTTFSEKRRTQRLKISVVKASENDLTFSLGFKDLDISLPPKILNLADQVLSSENNSGDPCEVESFQLSEGSHRGAVLVATHRRPTTSIRTSSKVVKVEEVPELLADWQTNFNMDIQGLDDKGFILLLQCGQGDDYEGLCTLNAKLKAQLQVQQEEKEYVLDRFVSLEENRVLDIFKRGVSSYLTRHFVWEEALLLEDSVEKSSQIDTGIQEDKHHSLVDPKEIIDKDVHSSFTEASSTDCSIEISSLEDEILKMWTCNEGQKSLPEHGLLFPGSEISFQHSTIALQLFPYFKPGFQSFNKFTIHRSEGSGVNEYAPLFFGKEYLLKQVGSNEERCIRFFRAGPGYKVGPVITCQSIEIECGRLRLFTTAGVNKRPSLDPVDVWMKSFSGTTMFFLQSKASLVDIALKKFRDMAAALDVSLFPEDSLIRSLLIDNFEEYKKLTKIPHNLMEVVVSKWKELQTEPYNEPLEQNISPDVKAICLAMHRDGRELLDKKVSTMVRNTITPLLKEKVKTDMDLRRKALEEEGKNELKNYIQSLRDKFSRWRDGTPVLSIMSCNIRRGLSTWDKLWGKQEAVTGNLIISYSMEFTEKENVGWLALELAPLKKDLDSLSVNKGQVVIPRIQAPMKLINLDSREKRLLKVVYTRSGQVLVFVEQIGEKPLLTIYLCSKLGAKIQTIAELRRRVDMVAYDESSKFIALYVNENSLIQIHLFDETFSRMEWTGIQTNLKDHIGSQSIIWMRFVPGKPELVLIDSTNCIRLLELAQTPMLRARQINLSYPFTKACITADGLCLIVLRKIVKLKCPEEVQETGEDACTHDNTSIKLGNTEKCLDGHLALEVYWLDTMVHLKSYEERENIVSNIENLEASVVTFGAQVHLLIYDKLNPAFISSRVLVSSSASEVCEMRVQNNGTDVLGSRVATSSLTEDNSAKSCPELDFIYHIFDKYSTSPPLKDTSPDLEKRDIHINILLRGMDGARSGLGVKCETYIKKGLERLRTEKGKDFSMTSIVIQSDPLDLWLKTFLESLQGVAKESALAKCKPMPFGDWFKILVCLVPIQIARAENNGLKPLVDGLQIPSHLSYGDAISLADMIRFGFYESILESWVGEIKVISSMGKQSSGKSYLLNHLSGSLLDVSGGRCTDGVWLTIRPTKECMYILLDFEGLGSFERSEQEDMLLSVFNAAVSNITIFNKKDFHLDKETEAVFEKFQNGVSLVKEDSKLFQGLFYIAIKDVDNADVEDLKAEFQDKISQICNRSQHNFLTRMYGGEVEIAAMPPFQRSEYHNSIKEIALTVDELVSCHQNGLSFLRDLKLVLAQISAKDWSSIDSKRVAFRICLIQKHLAMAISSGCLTVEDGASPEFTNFDTGEAIADSAELQVFETTLNYLDTGVQLAPSENQVMGGILEPIRNELQQRVPRTGENDESWHSLFGNFLSALASRRKLRVLDWLKVNTMEFQNDGDVQKLRLEAIAMLAELQQGLSLCSCKCQRCFLRCVQERSHPGEHSCKTSHICRDTCTYCAEEDASASTGGNISGCNDVAGHEGPHDCKEKSHTCGAVCSYFEESSNCNRLCTSKARHDGEHKCNSRQHMCSKQCSLLGCGNVCVKPFEMGEHDHHACHEKMCPQKCAMPGCNRSCYAEDHFHGHESPLENLSSSSSRHLCGSEHQCLENCEASGNCEILTEVVRRTSTFQGRRATFEYEHVSEQNGMRKTCCLVIPPFEESHKGPHSHTTNSNAVHFCETRCQGCGYFCHEPMGHTGPHKTNHGNMRAVNFVSETEEIDILDRKYTWGESGEAEMCMMHCKNQGRGHIHLIPCPTQTGGTCLARLNIEGARHETCKYGPDVNNPKDELTHAAFWKYMRFQDPCTEDEQRVFALCSHQCRSSEHSVNSISSSQRSPSYCVEPLWHSSASRTGPRIPGAGYVTDDGHRFSCDHSKDMECHVVFVIDRSGSMGTRDCSPQMVKFRTNHANRLGCVYESILRFLQVRKAKIIADSVSVVLFDHEATIAVQAQPLAETVVDQLLPHRFKGGTDYSCGITVAETILASAASNRAMEHKSPVVIFLSDGGNGGGSDPLSLVRRMKQVEPKLVFHTIKFGQDPYNKILKDMAAAGSGTFQVSLDEIQLSRSFEGLAHSLKKPVSSLM